jgi:hypothetical protein
MKRILIILAISALLIFPPPSKAIDHNWDDPIYISEYVIQNYSDISRYIIKVISIESNFDYEAKNPQSSAVGLMQITKILCKDYNIPYELVRTNPEYNLLIGADYLRKCLIKANYKFEQAYLYYRDGINYKTREIND